MTELPKKDESKSSLKERFFGFMARTAISHKTTVFILVGLITAASLAALPHLRIFTTRQGMTLETIPEQKRFNEYMDDFGTPTQLVLLLEGERADVMKAADDAAAALNSDRQWVRNVFYKLDLAAFEKSGLYYAPMSVLSEADQFIKAHLDWLGAVLSAPSLPSGLDQMSRIPSEALPTTGDLGPAFEILDGALASWQDFLENPSRTTLDLIPKDLQSKLASQSGFVGEGGYLLGKNGRSALLFVQQSQNIDDSTFTVPFMAYCRASVSRALARHPNVKAGFTGWPVAIEEEMGMLKRDLGIVSIGSTVLILLLLLVSFRSIRKTLLVFIPHTFGVIWNLGATYLAVGHLNYFSSVFFGLLFSLGMDYGIVFIRRFSEERVRGFDPADAVTRTFQAVGPGLVISSLSTITAFVAIGVSGIPGFSEMGAVAGMGMFCLIVATLVIMPPLLMLFGPAPSEQSERKVLGAGAVNTIWRVIDRAPGAFAGFGLIIAAGAIALLPRLSFDYNLDNLLPANSETIQVAKKVEQATGYRSQFLVVTVDNLEQVRKVQDLLLKKSTVESVQSLAAVVPEQSSEKRVVLDSISASYKAIPDSPPAMTLDLAGLRTQLSGFVEKLQKDQDDAFSAGKTTLVGQLEKLIGRLTAIKKDIDGPDAASRETPFESALSKTFAEFRARFAEMLLAPPMTIESAPADIRERFVGKSGRLAVLVFPKEDIWDIDFLHRFVGDVKDASAQVMDRKQAEERTTGFGAVYAVTSKLVTRGFAKALAITLALVLVLLLIDFRRIKDTLLALVPILLGISMTLAIVVLFGQRLNMASQIALPILIGIGVDFGVHTLHRWREPDGIDLAAVVSTTGASLWLAGATMMIGFGILIFARYRGLASFGQVLTIGIFICFTGAMFGLPALIKALKLDERKGR